MRINDSTSSGLKTGDQQVLPGPGSLHGIDVISAASGVNYITLYDSADSNTSGKLELAFVEADAGMVSINHEFFTPVVVNNGIYVKVTGSGSGAQYIVRFAAG